MTWHLVDENVDDVNGVMTAVNGEFSPEKSMLTWQLNNNGERLTDVNGGGELTAETKGKLTWQMNNNGGVTTVNVNDDTEGVLTWQISGEVVTDEMKNMLTWQMNNNGGVTTVNDSDDTKGVLTWQFSGEVVTDETKDMLTWQNDKEDENELSKFLEEASWSEMMTCQNTKVKIINDPYWLPLKFQTGAAYVTINGNEELCGSSFSDSDTSYMAGISSCSGFVGGAWDGVADEARGDWGECEDEMLARFLGESE